MATSGDISFTMALNWQITAVRTFFPYMECMYSAFKFTGGSREFRQTRHSVSYHCIRSSSVGYIQYKCLRFCLMCIRNCASIIVSCREVWCKYIYCEKYDLLVYICSVAWELFNNINSYNTV